MEQSKELMPEKDNGMAEKAVLFFQRARKAADTGNFDYAIEMYIEGLRCSPDDILQGHAALRELALKRQGKGGKKPSMMEKVKHLRAKEPLEQMLNAEYLLAKGPDNLTHAEDALKAAIAGQYNQTAQWIADFLFAANNASDRPSFKTYLLLKDSYSAIGRFERALAACARAHHLKPEDEELPAEIKRLSAELTISKGKYDQTGDFHQSIKDRESQEDMQLQSRAMKTIDYRQSALQKARQAYEREPQIAQNVFNLAQTLAEMETAPTDLEAIKLLENRYAQTKDFSFKQRAGQIYMNQLRRKIRLTRAELETYPGNGQTKQQLNDLSAKLNAAELTHYKQCV
ncbi:MAG: hypothetical protein PHF37_10340, partial [Phycisphaerae bacterium]|nr:hypothetical protein [Phycisphaerae bacterium]